jgi:hypothetical protein
MPPPGDAWLDLGRGVECAPVYGRGGELVGLLERHCCVNNIGDPCDGVGSLPFLGARGWPDGWPRWSVQTLSPLTIEPSVRCQRCGRHGFIRGGVWVPCADDGLPPGRRAS